MFFANKIITITLLILSFLSNAYATTESDSAIEQAVLVHINQYRQQHGLSKLKMDNAISIQAKQHSLDMANHRMSFGHKYFEKRIAKLRTQIKNFNGGAENVAYNYKDARQVVSQWVLSPGHKRNIVGNYNLTGIGVARDKQGKLYYTQIFLNTNKAKYSQRRMFITPFFRKA